jgi:hypothetical protein
MGMRMGAEVRSVWRTFVVRFREFCTGLTMPTRGGCVCDPVAWERDARMRRGEQDDAAGRPADAGGHAPTRQLHDPSA